MELTEEQINFLDKVCWGDWTLNSNGEVDVRGSINMTNMNLTEIPVKFGRIYGSFYCSYTKLTTLQNTPNHLGGSSWFIGVEYFKSIKEEDFDNWDNLWWDDMLRHFPNLINIAKKYIGIDSIKQYITKYPQTKLYYKD